MLQALGLPSLDKMVDETIPDHIRTNQKMELPAPLSEQEFLQHAHEVAAKNQLWRSYIGMGYYGTFTPPVIQRNILENPGWYTQYTPYQAEIAQGRLEALLNFQTMVSDLTGLDVANASLLDEATAAAEAMAMAYRIKNKRAKKDPAKVILVDKGISKHTLEVLQTRAEPMDISIILCESSDCVFDETVFAVMLQYPAQYGQIVDPRPVISTAQDAGVHSIVIADLLSLSLLQAPGEWGVDMVVGTTQRFGIPLGYGGPHAAYFATKTEYARQIPGRVIGVSQDVAGKPALRMALQTREQHIRRDKATSNICTAQALLAIMAGMYGVYHGPEGIKHIANKIHKLCVLLHRSVTKLGYEQTNTHFFDTLVFDLSQHTETSGLRIRRVAELDEVNFRYFEHNEDLIGISLDETCDIDDVNRIVRIFAEGIDAEFKALTQADLVSVGEAIHALPEGLLRNTPYLTHEVFNSHHSETQMLRYIKHLEGKDLSLTHSMIPLGSCTMKLNATAQLMPISIPAFSQLHPFVPEEQAAGYSFMFKELEQYLSDITGFAACSLQPNSGAQGEYTGLMVIRAYHLDRGDTQRDVALIPSSAHGTNPASAVMSGMRVVVVKCDDNGNIDVTDLKAKAEKFSDNLAALMVTYPSTHGVFEVAIQDICACIHEHGGLVYMDGANMNAQVGLTNPGIIGADVCHLNLHKTFAIPHGGGGPGMGPICCTADLAPYLPKHIHHSQSGGTKGISAVASAPYSSASILWVSYAYIRLLGEQGLTDSTRYAILNANYIQHQLQDHYPVLYRGDSGRVAHELILDLRPYKKESGVEVVDIAKRLMDYGFHAPTVSFPVPGTIMIEPTESEDLAEIDRFCAAMIAIRQEISAIADGSVDKENNPLKNAPHTLDLATADEWEFPYSRQQAVYPLPYLQKNKFWASVRRVNDTYGDRNLVCTCPPISSYEEEEVVSA